MLRSFRHEPSGPGRLIVAVLALGIPFAGPPAACAQAQAAGPFPEVRIEPPPQRSHAWAYACLTAGVGLIGASFQLHRSANDLYASYLRETEPQRIEDLFDRTELYDRLSGGSLLLGEVLLATGIYLRFLRRPEATPLSLELAPGRCALSLRLL